MRQLLKTLLFSFILSIAALSVFAQSPVIINQPYKFQKWISVNDYIQLPALQAGLKVNGLAIDADGHIIRDTTTTLSIFKLKSDSILNSGYATNGHLNKYKLIPGNGLINNSGTIDAGGTLTNYISYNIGDYGFLTQSTRHSGLRTEQNHFGAVNYSTVLQNSVLYDPFNEGHAEHITVDKDGISIYADTIKISPFFFQHNEIVVKKDSIRVHVGTGPGMFYDKINHARFIGTSFTDKIYVDSTAKAKADSVVSAHPGTGGTVTSITPGYGFTSSTPITASGTLTIDTTVLLTVANTFPKNDTRYYTKTAADAKYAAISGGNSFTGSQYLNTTSVMTTPDSIAFLGDSYIAGFGVLAYQRMSTIAAGKLNAIEVNLGVGGSTVEEQSPTMPFGVSSYVARKATIPVYNSHYLALVINGSINDPTLNSANYNVTNYTADLGTNIIDYAVSVRGWPAGKILLVSQPYKSPTSYVSRNGNPAATDAINISFSNATKAVATAKGTRYLDQYNLLKNNGGKLLEQADSLHLNPSGHRIIGNAIANSVGLIIKQNGQQLAVNGLTQLSKIRLSNTDTLQSKGHTIIVADSLGNIVYAPNKYISNVSDTTAANAQGANLNVNGVVRGSNLIANQTVKALGPMLTGSYLNSASAGTYPTNKLGLYLLGSAARGFIDSYSTTSANTGNQLDIQSQSLGDVNIYGNINFKSTGKLITLASPLILNTYLQIPNATGVYPGTKTGGLITANITAMYIDAFSSSGGVGLPLFLNNQSTQAVQSYGSFSVMNAKAFNVGTGVSTFGGPVFVTPFTSAGVVTNNGSAQLVSSPSLSVILGGSGQTSYTNGQLLIGNTTGNTLTKATLTASAATGLLIANGLGSITISNDTTVLLTVANTFPKNDTRYQKISTAFTNPMSTLGDIIYGGASGVATRLAGNTTTTQKFLTSTGNGTISAAPAYFDLFGGNNTWGGNNTLNGALNLNGGANFKGGIASAFYNTANTFSINLGVNTVTANRNITLPDASGELLLNTSGSFSGTGTATTTFTVTIGTTQANTAYKVNVTPTSLVAAAVFYVNNKTTTTFDVVYVAGLTGAVSFDWALFK